MSDTEIMKTPDFKEDEKLTDSQVIPFKDATDALSPNRGSNIGQPTVSVIGESLHFKGELSVGEDLIIEGKVEGTINQGKCCLTLKPIGRIRANVNATKIFIEGDVKGDLHATVSVTVRDSGMMKGNIVAPRVAIEEGATFNGAIDMRSPAEPAK